MSKKEIEAYQAKLLYLWRFLCISETYISGWIVASLTAGRNGTWPTKYVQAAEE
jgi:hypothetical protein